MIYLIDDKIERQKNLKWDKEYLAKYADVLFPIYFKDELDKVKSEIFKGDNIILFHESFFDNPQNLHEKDVLQIREDIRKYSDDKSTIVVFFSGSIGSRSVDKNSAYMPVQALYSNLASFCEEYRKRPHLVIINQIVFGNDFVKEELLLLKNRIWSLLYDQDQNDKLKMTAVLNNEIEDLEKIYGQKIVVEGVTNDYLKYQIQKLGQ
jgi:hypothetical protein